MDDPNMFDIDDDYDEPNELRIFINTLGGESALFTVTKDTKIEDFEKKYRKEMKIKSKCGVSLTFIFVDGNLIRRKHSLIMTFFRKIQFTL